MPRRHYVERRKKGTKLWSGSYLGTGKVNIDWKGKNGRIPLSGVRMGGHKAVVETLIFLSLIALSRHGVHVMALQPYCMYDATRM